MKKALGSDRDIGVHPALRDTNAETGERTGTGTGTTPELGDTGFYRQRAELASYSQSELINIPRERRPHQPHPHDYPDNPTHAHDNSDNDHDNHQPDTNNGKPRTHIITPDGILLSANFERLPGCEDYATSFAQCFDGLGIQLVEEEVLPAYYDSGVRPGNRMGMGVEGAGLEEKRRESVTETEEEGVGGEG